MAQFEQVAVHGRFQPPLHENHWRYVRTGFEMAEHVRVLITNPDNQAATEETATWRSDPSNNPFSYDQRIGMFTNFFTAIGIAPQRYSFEPFAIKDPAALKERTSDIPYLVNVYSKWSAKKVDILKDAGLHVVRLELPEPNPVSGSMIRELIRNTHDPDQLTTRLEATGFMPQAIDGLLAVLGTREDATNRYVTPQSDPALE